ncbi:hypothetical protein ASD65_16500 [Microbacterium sp. Root61]|uniref:hypothetical protein n=1 Tax=Microbacterium sp. Root61 TaxID=1736570 RepID=UPI0006F2186E|nr:hypothetical protein [Microbacterium sp. Root61]KRA22119.1 hypothetical protein ASD65_16500 [Microbacterium sp. Root61]
MTHPSTQIGSTKTRSPRTAWLVGGSLLIATALLESALSMLFGAGGWTLGVGIAADLLFAAAMVVFAFGLVGGGSVVGRRPLGVTALLVLGLWPLVMRVMWVLIPPIASVSEPLIILSNVSLFVQLAAAIIAVVQIARAGVVPGVARWLPLIALALVVVPEVIVYGFSYAAAAIGGSQLLTVAFSFAALARFVSVAGLGVSAIILALRPVAHEERTVQVYPPAS